MEWDLQNLFEIQTGGILDYDAKVFIFPYDFQKVNNKWPFQNNRYLCSSSFAL